MTSLPPHLRAQRHNLAKKYTEFHFSIMPTKLFIYHRGANTPFVTFIRDGQLYRCDDITVTSVREALEWARSYGSRSTR